MHTYSIQSFSFAYPGAEAPLLRDICLDIKKGQFVTLVGKSGSGKTTLLRQLKTALAPHGAARGQILFEGAELGGVDRRTQAARIGFVLQSPDNQLVTDKVWHELAFGLESLGLDTPTIRLRVAEMAAFFGIEAWFYRDVGQLSGGQKQLVNLASVMAMQPSVLILDEPTSQLDPIAAGEFLATIARINRELGTTVILTEHRLEDALPLSDRVIALDEGRVIADGTPEEVGRALKAIDHDMFLAMPTPMRVYAGVESHLPCPVTVRQGRDWLEKQAAARPPRPVPQVADSVPQAPPAIEISGAWFKYEPEAPDVLRGLDLTVPEGAFYAVAGGNGAGKSTMLSVIAGIHRPYRGQVRLGGRSLDQIPDSRRFGGLLGVLPQNPQSLFVKSTVALDLQEMLADAKLLPQEKQRRIDKVTALCQLGGLLERHPYDLSGGEQQRAALAKVLLSQPRILLLDEPTKGLDAHFKERLAVILGRLRADGVTILMVSHDIEFCARHADRCALFFDGAIVAQGTPQAFFSGTSYYTTAASRMARGLLDGAVTAEDIILAFGGTVMAFDAQDEPERPEANPAAGQGDAPPPGIAARERQKKPLPRWRKALGCIFIAAALALALWVVRDMPLGAAADLLPPGLAGLEADVMYPAGAIAAAVCALCGAVLLGRRAAPPPQSLGARPGRGRLPRRTLVAAVMILLLIPLTLYVGAFYLGSRRYLFISIMVVIETMVPFFMVFEGRKPQARELVVIATLCAIAVAGRAAFFFLPQFKPVAALVIISAVAFGGEAGFLVGAVSMLVSNMFFAQGPFTPFQMFAMGIIGFLAGLLFGKGRLGRSRVALCAYGGLSVFFVYGFIMNTYTVFQTQANVTWGMIITACAAGAPMDLVHALSTVVFLWIGAPAMLEKLDRIKTKYGLVE